MADATRAAFSKESAAPYAFGGQQRAMVWDDGRHDRIAFHYSIGAQPAGGGGATMVVQKLVPRFAGTTPVRGMHEFVMP
jgi:hypothetical protein